MSKHRAHNSLLLHPALALTPRPTFRGGTGHTKNPYLRILSTPLRFCAVSKFKFPSAMLLRFKVLNGELCTDKDARQQSHKVHGRGISVICRKTAVQVLLADKLYTRISRGGKHKEGMIEAIETELLDNVIGELDAIIRKLRSNCLKGGDNDVLMSNRAPWLLHRGSEESNEKGLRAGLVISFTDSSSFSHLGEGEHRPPIYTLNEQNTKQDQRERIQQCLLKMEEYLQRRGCDTGDQHSHKFALGFGVVSDGDLSVDLSGLSTALWRCRMWHQDAHEAEGFGLFASDVTTID
ncbi:hypothetical protein E3P99_02763 [Wallemia hederae]|uniref:Uncharacterized protein n=1 Tax=Wallemia hederae TaxID=1540922 RepID=A0A4V4LSX1_9BASI|nr:hypothetical protein E3P99_02763 [Wallemia hederae]